MIPPVRIGTEIGYAVWTDDNGPQRAPLVVSDRPQVGQKSGWKNALDGVDAIAQITAGTPEADTVALVRRGSRYIARPVDILHGADPATPAPYDLPGHARRQFDAGRTGPDIHITHQRVAAVTDDGMASFRVWPPEVLSSRPKSAEPSQVQR